MPAASSGRPPQTGFGVTTQAEEGVALAKDIDHCLDCDAHEMIPNSMWEAEFGETGRMAHDMTCNMASLGR